jgi:HTH-type transcriptional regulator/antitoxin HigA
MANNKFKIENAKDYNALMKAIDALMKKGEKNLKDEEIRELQQMSLAAQAYEKSIYTVPAPKTLEGLFELEMYRRRLKQKDLAALMEIKEPKLSRILSKKRPVDVEFLKAAHEKLDIDANLLLRYI